MAGRKTLCQHGKGSALRAKLGMCWGALLADATWLILVLAALWTLEYHAMLASANQGSRLG